MFSIFSDLFAVIRDNSTSLERKILFLTNLIYAFEIIAFIGYPIFFLNPKFICPQQTENILLQDQTQYCSSFEACQYPNFTIDYPNSPLSLTTEFDLVCDRATIMRNSISILFLGGFIGCIFSVVNTITPETRKRAICQITFVCGVTQLISARMTHPYIIAVFMSFINFLVCPIYTQVLQYYTEVLGNEDLIKVSPAILGISACAYGVFFPILAYFVNDSWRILNISSGIILIIAAFALYILKEKSKKNNNLSQFSQEQSQQIQQIQQKQKFDLIYEVYQNRALLINFLLLMVANVNYIIVMDGTSLELGSMGGDVHTNTIFINILSLIVTFISGSLILKYSAQELLTYSFYLTGLGLLIFIVAPFEIKNMQNVMLKIGFTASLLTVKGIMEMAGNIIYVATAYHLRLEFVPIHCGLSMLISRVPQIFLPQVAYFFKLYSIHPLAAYGVFTIFVAYAFRYLTPLKDIVNDFVDQEEILEVSVLMNSFSMGGFKGFMAAKTLNATFISDQSRILQNVEPDRSDTMSLSFLSTKYNQMKNLNNSSLQQERGNNRRVSGTRSQKAPDTKKIPLLA